MTTVNSKIIMRRGPSWTLPGKAVSIGLEDVLLDTGNGQTFVDQPSDDFLLGPQVLGVLTSKGLDEAELGFTTDESRLFVGLDPTNDDLPQNTRYSYPFRNIEVIGANSRDGFNLMHGNQMRDDDERSYYSAPLYANVTAQNVLIGPDLLTGYRITGTSVFALIDYSLTEPSGSAYRAGQLQISSYNGVIDVIDECDMVRAIDPADTDYTITPQYDPNATLGMIRFNFVTTTDSSGTYLRFQYTNSSDIQYGMDFRVSRPDFTKPSAFGVLGYQITITGHAVGHI